MDGKAGLRIAYSNQKLGMLTAISAKKLGHWVGGWKVGRVDG